MKLEIIQTTVEHLKSLDQNIRPKDKLEALRLGFEPIQALIQCHKYAIVRKTILIDRQVAAVYGVTGNLFSDRNTIYLATSNVVTKLPHISFVRIYIAELEELSKIFQKLDCFVDAQYSEAIKLIEFVGFKREQTLELNGNQFYLYSLES